MVNGPPLWIRHAIDRMNLAQRPLGLVAVAVVPSSSRSVLGVHQLPFVVDVGIQCARDRYNGRRLNRSCDERGVRRLRPAIMILAAARWMRLSENGRNPKGDVERIVPVSQRTEPSSRRTLLAMREQSTLRELSEPC